MQTLGSTGVDVAVGGVELDAQSLETQDMHIDLASTQVAAARHGDLARWKRPSRGPITAVEARILRQARRALPRIDLGGIDLERVLVENFDRSAHALEHLPITWTSEISGTFRSVVLPGARSVAAMSLSAEFLAPETGTEPPMAWPPSTRIISKVYPFKKHARGGWAIPG